MPIRFVAIVDAQNEPAYFKSAENASKEVGINHQFIAEMSLDFIEQQAAQLQVSLHKPLMVMIHDGIAVYAMLSNTRIKYIVGIDCAVDGVNVDGAVNAVADTFVSYQCNPFGTKQGPIKSTQFDEKIEKIIEASRP